MTSLGFMDFKEKLISGEKRQTIRKLRKRPIKLGEKLHLFWKLRTKQCELLRVEICKEAFFVTIQYFEDFLGSPNVWRIDKSVLTEDRRWPFASYTMQPSEAEELAKRDGFDSVLEMMKALQKMHGELHSGSDIFQVIRW